MKETKWDVYFWFDRYELALKNISIYGVYTLADMEEWVQDNKSFGNFIEIEGHIINFDRVNYVYPRKVEQNSIDK